MTRRAGAAGIFLAALVLCGGLASGCAREAAVAAPPGSDVTEWMRLQLAIARAERLNPANATRIAAYSAIALHEGYAAAPGSSLSSLGGRLNGLSPLPTADGPVDPGITAAEAERVVLGTLVREGFATTRRAVDSLADAQVARREALGVSAESVDRSRAHGRRLGEAIVAWAATDSFAATRGRPYTLPSGRGTWVLTATPDQHLPEPISGASDVVLTENAAVALDAERATTRELFLTRPKEAGNSTLAALNPSKPTEPYWGRLRPFVLTSATECPIPDPPAYSEEPGSPFWQMAKVVWDSTKALREDQRQVALFWADNAAMTGTPAFHWMSILAQVIGERGLDREAAARTLVLTTTGIADAFIATWEVKYRTMVVRPVTYIRRVWDPGYQTTVITPSFPEYPSGHSTQSGAAAAVLIAQLGDSIPFADSTQRDIGYPARQFRGFSHARDEVAISRLYGGIHYLPAIVDGVTMGECIAGKALERLGGSAR